MCLEAPTLSCLRGGEINGLEVWGGGQHDRAGEGGAPSRAGGAAPLAAGAAGGGIPVLVSHGALRVQDKQIIHVGRQIGKL